MVSVGSERGRARAVNRLLTYVDELGDRVKDHRIIIGHTDAPEIASLVADQLRQRYGNEADILMTVVNPTTGAHCGPDGVGICFHAKHR